MKRFILAAVLAATTAMTINAPEADARGGRGFSGGSFRASGFHGGGFRHHHRHYRIGYVAPIYSYGGYCRWYYTPYGKVRRCSY